MITLQVEVTAFKIADQVYGFDNRNVCSVRLVSEDKTLFSEIFLLGKDVPVIDLRQRLGFPLKKPGRLDRIIILNVEGELVGIKVDEVLEEVSRLEVEEVNTGGGEDSCFISGIGHWRNEPIIILNSKKLFLEEIRCYRQPIKDNRQT